jgi:neurofibromin 1
MTFVPSTSTDEDNKPPRQVSYAPLLNTHVITTHKSQILFLHFLASALIQTQIESRVQLLYEFLADASEVFTDIFPLIQLYLVPHLSETLGASHCPAIIKAVHSIIHNSVVSSDESLLIKPTYISDVGFKGVTEYFRPFSKSGSFYPTQTEALFQRYIEALVQEITPAEGMERIHSLSSLSSMTEQSDIHLGPVVTPIRRSFSSSNSRQGSSSREITPDTDILEEEEVLSCDDIIL